MTQNHKTSFHLAFCPSKALPAPPHESVVNIQVEQEASSQLLTNQPHRVFKDKMKHEKGLKTCGLHGATVRSQHLRSGKRAIEQTMLNVLLLSFESEGRPNSYFSPERICSPGLIQGRNTPRYTPRQFG